MFKLPAYFTGFGSKVDGSASLRFSTQEIDADSFVDLKLNLNKFGWVIFSESEISEADIPKEPLQEDGKSPSQRLRGVQFLVWKQKNIGGDFDAWRKIEMEKIINKYKDLLD